MSERGAPDSRAGGATAFVTPDFSAPLDVEACIARCLPEATAKGMFLTAAADLGRRAAPSRAEEIYEKLSSRRWTPFLEYPLRDLMRLMVNASSLRWPHEPVRERLRRVGWLAYPTFTESMTGRILLGVTSKEIESKFSSFPKAYSLVVSHASVAPRRVADRHWQLDYKSVYCFLDSYHVGIIEGFARSHGYEAEVRVRLTSEDAGTFDLRW